MLDGRLFHAGTGTHIHALNKLSSSVNNGSPLSVAEQISEEKKRNMTKNHRQITSGDPATQI